MLLFWLHWIAFIAVTQSYNFRCLILCKQMSYIIVIKILTVIMQYVFILKKL